jgi:hypothetical protein
VRYCLDRSKQGLRLHHHPGPAAKRAIIRLMVAVVRVITQVMNAYFNQARDACAANYSKVKDP